MNTINEYMETRNGRRITAGMTGETMVERLTARLRRRLSVRRTQERLRTLSNRELADIGLTRDQVEAPGDWPRDRIDGSR